MVSLSLSLPIGLLVCLCLVWSGIAFTCLSVLELVGLSVSLCICYSVSQFVFALSAGIYKSFEGDASK